MRFRFPDVEFAAVAIRGDRDELRRRVRERGWELLVGHDRDGAVANAYAVAVCPQITFVASGGEVRGTRFGSLDEAQARGADRGAADERRAGGPARPRLARRGGRAPGAWVAWTEVETVPGPTPPELRERLRRMADRMHGAEAIALRGRDVAHAYRVFFRHVGARSRRRPYADRGGRAAADVGGRPAPAGPGPRRADRGGARDRRACAAFDGLVGAPRIEEADGRLVIADEQGPVAVLFGDAERAAPTTATRRVALVAVAVPGVADLSSRRRSGRPGTSCARDLGERQRRLGGEGRVCHVSCISDRRAARDARFDPSGITTCISMGPLSRDARNVLSGEGS